MEKKVSIRDIYPINNEDYSYEELYRVLQKQFGENNVFASFQTIAGNYIWKDTHADWQPFSTADGIEQEEIMQALDKARKSVASTFSDAVAVDLLFTYPDENFIYFVDEIDSVRILITGWGFKKPKHVPPGPSPYVGVPIDVGFIDDGVIVPDFEFTIRLTNGQLKHFRTNSDGRYHFRNIREGKSYEIVELAGQRSFNLSLVKGQTEYLFDITRTCQVVFHASQGDQPIVGEEIKVEYHGNSNSVTTSADGSASLSLPYHQDETLTATMRDKKKSVSVELPQTVVDFSFELEEPETPPVVDPPHEPETENKITVTVKVNEDGIPVNSEPVKLEIRDTQFDLLTDSSGCAAVDVDFSEGMLIVAYCRDQEQTLEMKPEDNVIVFDFKKPVPNLNFTFLNVNGKPISNGNVTFSQDDKPAFVVHLDNEGKVSLPRDKFSPQKPIQVTIDDGKTSTSPINFTLEENENDYVFQKRPDRTNFTGILTQILAVIGAIAAAIVLWPFFDVLCWKIFELVY